MFISPALTLAIGVALALVTIAAVGAYTFAEVRRLRDEQTAISERNRKGEVVSPSSPLPPIEFARDGQRYIRAEVPQASASRVREGLPARITDDTHAEGTWTGRVTYVSGWFARRRSVLQEPLQFNDVRTLECIIRVNPDQPALRLGQRMRVSLGQLSP